MSFKKDQVISLVAGTIVLIVLGSLYTFGSLTPYIYSYLYYQGSEVSLVALSILFTIAIIMVNVGMSLGNLLSSRLTNQVICAIAVACVATSVFISSFMTSFVGFILFYGILYGLSIGIGYLAPVKNAYLHLPARKGLCAGICMSGFGFGSVIFNQVILHLVNPHDMKADSNNRFPQKIANNVPYALKILALIYLLGGLAGTIFIRPPKKQSSSPLLGILQPESVITQTDVDVGETEVKAEIPEKQNPWAVFREKKAYLLIIQYALVVPFGLFVAFNYKEIAFYLNPYFKEHDHLITIVGSVGIFSNGLFRSMWGILFDTFSFEKLISAISIVLLLCCAAIYFAVNNFLLYLVVIVLNYLAYGGTFALLPTQAVRLMGSNSASQTFWATFSGFSCSSIIQFTIHYLLITNYGKEGFKYCFLIFFGLELAGVIMACTIKYRYSQEEMDLIKGKLK